MSPDGSAKAPTPEERLLKLIRGKGRDPAPPSPVRAAPDAISTVVAPHRWGDRGWSARWPQWVGGILGVVVVAEVGLVVFQLFRPVPTVELPSSLSASAPAVVSEPAVQPPPVPTLVMHASKPLFVAPVIAPPEPEPTRVAPSRQAKELAARLNLLGIVAGEPAQVIIEDSRTKKSYFVTEGQTLIEGAVVSAILDNRVVLDFLGETIELTL